ncbi:hypothetical protein GGR34_000760 [Microvirga flocculans]|uniref:Uncharacterized protein n=1 Tax=Microvirga flocculans TaxID=217168 RepID=A0A7W6ICW6_9HYPH|nr:DUF3310 domain-containing protein [Microvirga flocculans]MBB4039125.1 hypothetical protein [Microvirga flocculans]
MAKFNQGDKVRVSNVTDVYVPAKYEGAVGIIDEVFEEQGAPAYRVIFDEYDLYKRAVYYFKDRHLNPVEPAPRMSVWCGLCGTYINEGDVFPCVKNDAMPTFCGAIGAPATPIPGENGHLKDDEAVASDDDEPDYDRDALNEFIAVQEAQAAHEYERDRAVIAAIHEEAAARGAPTALDTQVGGNHYSKLKIQPFEYSMANGLGPAEHTAIKYVTRWKDKGGIKDIDKAIHTLHILKDWAVANGFA